MQEPMLGRSYQDPGYCDCHDWRGHGGLRMWHKRRSRNREVRQWQREADIELAEIDDVDEDCVLTGFHMAGRRGAQGAVRPRELFESPDN